MAGNGLAVVRSEISLEADTMLRIAQELRQFETIFLFDVVDGGAEARIFTPEEELGFAGHPVLGRQPSCMLGRDEQLRKARSGASGSAAAHWPSRPLHAMAGSSGLRWTRDARRCWRRSHPT